MGLNQENIVPDGSETSVTLPDPLRTDLRSGQLSSITCETSGHRAEERETISKSDILECNWI